MANQIRDNNKCKKYLGMFCRDCFDKLFDKNIMVSDRKDSARRNTSLFSDLSLEERKTVINSINEILNYNPDFNKIVINYLLDSSKTVNYDNLLQFIKSQHSYYYYKAIIFAIIKTLLIIIQLITSIIIFYPKYECFDSQIKNKRNAILFLKIIYFIFFDFNLT